MSEIFASKLGRSFKWLQSGFPKSIRIFSKGFPKYFHILKGPRKRDFLHETGFSLPHRHNFDGRSSSESKEPRFRLLAIETNGVMYLHTKYLKWAWLLVQETQVGLVRDRNYDGFAATFRGWTIKKGSSAMAKNCRVCMQGQNTNVNGTIKRPLVKVHEGNFKAGSTTEYYMS